MSSAAPSLFTLGARALAIGLVLALAGCMAQRGDAPRFAMDKRMRACIEQSEQRAWHVSDGSQPLTQRAEVHALVIGVDYVGATDESGAANMDLVLQNAMSDACLVESAFDRLPEAHSSLVANPDVEQLQAAVDAFAASLSPNDIAVFYYAGHGVQAEGRNYFILGDGHWAVPVDEVLEILSQRARAVIFVVDACRNPVLPGAGAVTQALPPSQPGVLTRVRVESLALGRRGLAELGRARGTKAVVQFSTEPGNVAWDGEPGTFSPFARALYGEVGRRAAFDDVSRRIANRVACETALWDAPEFARCAMDVGFAAEIAGQAADRLARAASGTQGVQVQFPWRQGDVGFPIYLAGEPRFPPP